MFKLGKNLQRALLTKSCLRPTNPVINPWDAIATIIMEQSFFQLSTLVTWLINISLNHVTICHNYAMKITRDLLPLPPPPKKKPQCHRIGSNRRHSVVFFLLHNSVNWSATVGNYCIFLHKVGRNNNCPKNCVQDCRRLDGDLSPFSSMYSTQPCT